MDGIGTYVLTAETIVCTGMNSTLNTPRILLNGRDGAIYADGNIWSDGTISGMNITNRSLENIKKNITKFDNALDIIKNSEIYEYNFKTEKDTDKKHVGFVIGEKYNTPSIVKSNDGKAIESYTMSAIEWRALQELIKRLETVERKVN